MNHLKTAQSHIKAAASMVSIICDSLEENHQPAAYMLAYELKLCGESIDIALHGSKPSEELWIDVKSMTNKNINSVNMITLLDEYTGCRLSSISASLTIMDTPYLDSGERPNQVVGSALFEACQWIELAEYLLTESYTHHTEEVVFLAVA